MVHCDVEWCGMVGWHGMVMHSKVWHGMVTRKVWYVQIL